MEDTTLLIHNSGLRKVHGERNAFGLKIGS
jgi:hypothetical protein